MKRFFAVLIAFFFIGSASVVRGQDAQSAAQPDQQNSQQPPDSQQVQQADQAAPGVARISVINGSVSSQRAGSGEWVAVTVNTPLSVGDSVSTGQNSRAEVQLDYADILRLASNSTAKIASLSRSQIQVQVGQGLVTYSVLKGSEASAEIDTPNVAVHPDGGQGEFRILVNSDQETQVTVREGQAEITTPQGSTRVQKGDLITIAGTADNAQYKVTDAAGKDNWDNWNSDRNKQIENASSWRHTDRYYTGTQDLDPYGSWTEVPDYGQVWVPNQTPNWVPYRDGRWVYQPYYGWTWVSYEPWGWAPYHYGRWFVYGGNWAWWPGPVVAYPAYYPIWAPAYVSFFGWGGGGFGIGFGFGFGFGHIGWLPVGPCDFFHPWFGRFGGRVNVVNITNIHNTTIINNRNGIPPLAGNRRVQYSNVNRMLTDPHIRSGLSSMESRNFGQARVPVHQQAVSAATLRNASLMTGKMPVNPTRASYNPSGRAANPSTIRSTPAHFFTSSRANSQSQPSRIAANSTQRTNAGSRSAAATTANRPASVAAARQTARGSSSANVQPGWRSFGSGNSRNVAARPEGSRTPASGSQLRASQSARANVSNSPNRAFTPPASRSNNPSTMNQRNGWRPFTPPSHSTAPQNSRGFAASNGAQRTYTPPNTPYRGYSGGNSRPPLNMHQPIVTSRNNGGYRYATPGRSPAYAAPRGSGGGGYRAPSSSGGYHGGGGGASHSSGGHPH